MGSRMRKNKSQRDQRRSHLNAGLPRLTTDTETGSTHLRHRVDLKTGMYRGRQVLNVTNNTQPTTNNQQDDAATTDNSQTDDTKVEEAETVSS